MRKKPSELELRGAAKLGDPRYFSRSMPEMTDEDWAALEAQHREWCERWELEKAAVRAME